MFAKNKNKTVIRAVDEKESKNANFPEGTNEPQGPDIPRTPLSVIFTSNNDRSRAQTQEPASAEITMGTFHNRSSAPAAGSAPQVCGKQEAEVCDYCCQYTWLRVCIIVVGLISILIGAAAGISCHKWKSECSSEAIITIR